MYNFTSRLRRLVLSTILIGLAAGSSMAQSQMQARTVVNSAMVTSPELAIDDFLTTAATLTPTAITVGNALGQAGNLRVKFPDVVQKDQQASITIKLSASTATVLGGVVLKTFLSTSQSPENPIQIMNLNSSGLAQIDATGSGPGAKMIQFTATAPFDQIQLDAGALVNTNYSLNVYAAFATVAPLPVQLTAFSGKASETGVALNWATASERNADYFEVQRAEGLSDGFRSLGQVKSAGNSTQAHAYQFVDAAAAGRHYYRLRQVDMDGTERFSPVVTVDAGLLASLTAYPTLATHTLNITGPAGTHLSVFNQQGKQVQAADIAASQQQQLDVSGLPGGVYFLRDTNTGLTARFVKAGGDR